MLFKFAKVFTRKPAIVVIIAILLVIPCIAGYAGTKINYDILSYLPQNLDSTKGEHVLENTFHDAATSMLVVDNMEPKDVLKIKDKIKDVKGVNNVVWVDDLADISIPKDLLPQKVKDAFYSGNSTLLLITYDGAAASNETLESIGSIKKLLNKQCFLSGFSAIIKDTKVLADKEVTVYVVLAVALSIVAMTFCMSSWMLPFVFMLGIGLAVIYNFGTNIFLGEISYITKAIAAVLQLGVTMDYSIFLINRYDEEKPNYDDRRDAMAKSIEEAFVSLAGGSLTTIAGFFALCFMQLSLGKDIGIVMMKGVFFGIITTVTVLPSLILLFDKPIHKYTHRIMIPDFTKGSNFIIRRRWIFVALGLLLILPAIWSQSKTQVYYNLDRSLPTTMDSIVATNKLKKDFNMATTHFAIVDDSLPPYKLSNMISEIKNVDGVESTLAYDDIIGPTIPDSFIPQKVKDICKKDGRQLVMINSRYKAAEDNENNQIDEITKIIKKYDNTAQLTGEGSMTKDLIDTAAVDFKVTNNISMLCIVILIAVLFKSAIIPVILVAIIELAICINLGIPFFTGTVIPFISPTVIGCVQLGATIDYSILMTTRFQEELRKGLGRLDAIKVASKTSFPSIVTSSLVFFCATLGVSIVSKIGMIQSICSMLARGALISAAVIIFILPAVLYVTEPIINKLTFHWKSVNNAKNDNT